MKRFALTAVIATLMAAPLTAQPYQGKGEAGGWNIYFNEATGGCFMERETGNFVVQLGTEAAMLGEGDGEVFGFLAVYTNREVEVEDGAVETITFEIDGDRFGGEAKGVVREGYAGGYVVSNSEMFGDSLANKQTLIIGPDRATPTEIDLTGTKVAMEAVRACQAEMSN